MYLSENFTLEEFTFSETAGRRGIDNSLPSGMLPKAVWLAGKLELARGVLGALHINSAYRCLEVNRAIGSSDTSQHVKLEAVDCRSLLGLAPLQMCQRIIDSRLQFDQLIYEFQSWMHISFVQEGLPRRSVLTIDKRGTQHGLVA